MQELTKVKFGEMDNNDLENDSFTGGPSDASMAPAELTVYTKSGDMVIRNVMEHETDEEVSGCGINRCGLHVALH